MVVNLKKKKKSHQYLQDNYNKCISSNYIYTKGFFLSRLDFEHFFIVLKILNFLKVNMLYYINFVIFTFFSFFFSYMPYFQFNYFLIRYLYNKKKFKAFLIAEFIQNSFKVGLSFFSRIVGKFDNSLFRRNSFSSFSNYNSFFFPRCGSNKINVHALLKLPYAVRKRYYNIFLVPYFIKSRNVFYARFTIKPNNLFYTLFDGFGNKLRSLTKATLEGQAFRKKSPLLGELLVQEFFHSLLPIFSFFKKIYVSKEKKELIRRVSRAVQVLAGQATKFTPEYLEFLKDKYQIFLFSLILKFANKHGRYRSINYFVKRFGRSAPIKFKFFLSNKPFNGCRLKKRRRL